MVSLCDLPIKTTLYSIHRLLLLLPPLPMVVMVFALVWVVVAYQSCYRRCSNSMVKDMKGRSMARRRGKG